VCVGAGTVRADNPRLTVRIWPGGVPVPDGISTPRRVVLGSIPPSAEILPAESWEGQLRPLLEKLGGEGVLQLLVEGGADVVGRFHRAGLVDRYVVYLTPSLLGGDDGWPVLAGSGAATMADIKRGRFVAIAQLDGDLRVDLVLDS
jgi:diaminohydroxyphosphoribosylaminopyrimidine deaminase/5-amino-6-(5-phosphoribosylamino)uracil reductase